MSYSLEQSARWLASDAMRAIAGMPRGAQPPWFLIRIAVTSYMRGNAVRIKGEATQPETDRTTSEAICKALQRKRHNTSTGEASAR